MQYFNYKNIKNVAINLKGEKQIYNASMCIEACQILNKQGFKITNKAIYEGLRNVLHRARFETLYTKPTIIFDGAHNESAIQNLRKTIDSYYPVQRRIYIFSILKSKDYKSILGQLLKTNKDDIFFFTDGIDEDRYVKKEILYEEARKYRKQNMYVSSLKQAILDAKEQYTQDVIFIVGSFYTYAEVRKILKIEE